MKTYRMFRRDGMAHASVLDTGSGAEYELDPRHDLRGHSPSGFEWGYGGSGPAQLALAILADHKGLRRAGPGLERDEATELVLRCYQDFKRAVLEGVTDDEWHISGEQVDRVLRQIEGRSRAVR